MKVAVSSTGSELTSAVDPRFGRAPWFLFVDTETGDSEALDNGASAGAGSGAGIGAAEAVIRRGATHVLTGHCGPNAFRALSAAGVTVVVGASGTVGEAIEALKSGEMETANGPDVAGHSGM